MNQSQNIFDRVPPQSLDAEMSLLGSLMLDNEAINIISLTGTEFYKSAHRRIFETIREMVNANIAVDLTTLSDELKTKKRLDDIGGAYYLTELCEVVPSSANISEYETIIKTKWRLRQLIKLGHNVQKQAHEGKEEVNDIVNSATSELIQVSSVESKGKSIADFLHEFNDDVDRRKNGEIVHVHAPLIGNIERGETCILAARPSVGKTSMATQILFECGVPSGLIMLESQGKKIAGRMLAQVSDVDFASIIGGSLDKSQLAKVIPASTVLAGAPIEIEEHTEKIAEILAIAHQWVIRKHIHVLAIDYLQLVDGGKAENKNLEVDKITKQLVLFGKKNNVAMLILAQLNRMGTDEPGLHHLRDSGGIEQAADKVILLSRSEKTSPYRVKCHVAKNRNGATGSEVLNYKPSTMTFSKDTQ